ncbi:hypothetical protein B7H23_11855 [Notoacmeibacter marinus]|uniref:Glyoxalase-related protein domain-containing protein n=1 Tax=Notoacmeibacter marinus TaxID=1876515 RepID=A0A231UYL2_9HYPH|nr:glyoxalase superfamily protein [Notoacmeibacter marinus]OXT00954.1 hypothetical protein B7H23_11855 [Notoacmeibacter marinus]
MKPSISVEAAKRSAKTLRADLQKDGKSISHGKALELVAHQFGYADWNTLHAAIGNRPTADWTVGARVGGRYLGHNFDAEVISVRKVGEGWYRLVLDLDEPVDVVTFDSFSAYRKRIAGTIGPNGTTLEKTSDGQPHLVLGR